MFLEEVLLDARLIVLNIVSRSVPSRLLVEEPGVAGPEKTVQKPKQNGGIGFSKPSCRDRVTAFDRCISEIFILCVCRLTGVILVIDPGVAVSDGLQIEKTVCPGRGCRQPDEGNEGRQDKVDLWVVFLFISVEAGVEEVESEAVRGTEYDIVVDCRFPIMLPGGGVEPDHHSGENIKLGIGAEIPGEGEGFIILGFQAADGTFVLDSFVVVGPVVSFINIFLV